MPSIKAILSSILTTAWVENPGLAVQLTTRFASLKLANDVRSLLLKYPERALGEPDALQILIGASLPTDVSFQLKVDHYLTKLQTRLTPLVSALLGRCQSNHSRNVLPAGIPQ